MSTAVHPRVNLRPPPAPPRGLSPHAARRIAISVALTATAFVQAPGWIAADTKVDLYENPWGLLGRALHLWDPATASGSLQNQAFGYLFPQGPFYGVLTSAGLPPWVVQRLWWALVLVVAFNGAVALLTALRVGSPNARLVGGIVYALSPRIISAMGEVSSEIWPMAMAPWVLVPLVKQGMEGGDPRRAAARSGVAFLCVGAVNAVASIAVLLLPVIYLLTRRRSRAALRLALWWVLSVGLVSLWWFVALVLLGKYSPPFLDWIESSAVTTSPASVANSTRGTTAWLAYLAGTRGPTWPAGWTLVVQPFVILDTAVLAALGAAGLVWRGLRERAFLIAGALVGVVVLSIAWDGPFSSPVSGLVRTFLDGSGSPLRNIHKFDPLLRLVLVVGLTHLIATVRIKPVRQARWLRNTVPIVACFALLGAVTPLVVGDVGASPGYAAVPDYWRQAASWLDANAAGSRSLVVPGARPAVYYWGATNDDILQPLLAQPWTVRDGVPLGSAGNTRMLDAVELALGTGRGSDELANYLARSGVTYVVERNDIDWARVGVTRPTLVHTALEQSGLTRVAQFGPLIGGGLGGATVVDGGLGVDLPSVEVWRVPGAGPVVTRMTDLTVASGGPEDVLGLGAGGALAGTAVILSGDAGDVPPSVVTDGYRRREVNFGNPRANSSATMTADEPFRAPRRIHDYWPIAPSGRQSLAVFTNGVPSATSSGAAAGAQRNRSNGFGPYQAFDGDLRTAWRSSATTAVGQAVTLDGFAPQAVTPVRVQVDSAAGLARVQRLTVSAGDVSTEFEVDPSGLAVGSLNGLVTDTLTVTVSAVLPGDETRTVGISEVDAGVTTRRFVAPAATLAAGAELHASVPGDRRDGCVFLEERPLCSSDLPRPGEEDAALARRVTVIEQQTYDVAATARAAGGPAVNQLLNPLGPSMLADASSVLVPDPANRPQSAVDRDPLTGWIAGASDSEPTLRLSWPQQVPVSELQLVTDPGLAASVARRVRLTFDTGTTLTAVVGVDGRITVPDVPASSVAVTAVETDERTTLNAVALTDRILPWGVSEVVVSGADGFRRGIDPEAVTGTACGFGPDLVVDGVVRPTLVEGRIRDLLRATPMRVVLCEQTTLTWHPGDHDITLAASAGFIPDRLVLTPVGAAAGTVEPATTPAVRTWDPTHRVVDLEPLPTETILVVHENANAGWVATIGAERLVPVRVDGWQQGWRIPAATTGSVVLEFAPDQPYRIGLAVGLACALLVVLLALRRPRAAVAAPTASWSVPGWAADVAAPVLGLVLSGPVGLVLGVAMRVLARRSSRATMALVAGTCLVLAGVVAAARPWPQPNPGAFGLAAQALAVAGLCAVVASGSVVRRRAAASGGADSADESAQA